MSGELDVRNQSDVNKFFSRFDNLIGLSNLKVIHFNDSAVKFDGHNDHHANIFNGYIGSPEFGGTPDGFIEVIRWCFTYGIPMILETPSSGHINEIKMIKSLNKSNNTIETVKPKPKSKIVLRKKIKHIHTATTA